MDLIPSGGSKRLAQQELQQQAQRGDQQEPASALNSSGVSSVPSKGLVKGFGVASIFAGIVNGIILNLVLNNSPEGSPQDKEQEKSRMFLILEGVSWLCGVLAFLPLIPGFLKVGTFREASRGEMALFSFRTVVLGLDLVWLVVKASQRKTMQRLQRAEPRTIKLSAVVGVVDIVLSGVYSKQPKGSNAAAVDAMFAIPRVINVFRLDSQTAIRAVGLEIFSTFIATYVGMNALSDDLKALEGLGAS